MFILLYFSLSFALAAKNVILFIGDGMGPSVITAARIQYGPLAWDQFPRSAFITTHSNDNHVTDSAAAATAMATGVKTDNDVLGLGPKVNGNRKTLETLVNIVKAKKYSAGLVTTTTVTHATPAAFYAHNANRDDSMNIAKDLFASQVDLIYGGGTKNVNALIEKNKDRFTVLKTKQELPTSAGKKPYLGVFGTGETPYYETKEFDSKIQPRLSEMTLSALDVLRSNKNGFFLMVEGGRIDHALHKNNIQQALIETSEFSNAVAVTMEKLKKENLLSNTLVIITADHDTGGLSINGYLRKEKPLIQDRKIASSEEDTVLVLTTVIPKLKTSAAHTAVDVPLYATGICSDKFGGLMDNTSIFKVVKSCLD